MREHLQFLIDGRWVAPAELRTIDVVNPATEDVCGRIAAGSPADVDKAARAARKAFASYSLTSREARLDLLQRILDGCEARFGELAQAVTEEMGAPASLAQRAQVPAAMGHISATIAALKTYAFEEDRGATMIVKEPIGVCGLITPWNWPLNQIAAKVAPALAAGCTMVLKPSEVAPFSGQIFAEILHAAGVPAGVFNMIHGDGLNVGVPLSTHPEIDMVSFTGSTRAGVEVAKNAAPTVKRVAQELGGKSPNIVLDDAAFAAGVTRGVAHMMNNSGQSCNAPSRMLVPRGRMEEAIAVARQAAEAITVGDPNGNFKMGPVASEIQWKKVQRLIQVGIDEGATLVTGGVGRPEGLERGYYVKPTVFANVTNEMTIAREEIFGPVLAILGYDSVDQAVETANDTEYGLAAYLNGEDLPRLRELSRRLRAGQVAINGAADRTAPFGGYKMSGNGREWGDYGLPEYLETKAVLGWAPPAAE